mgnify:CR=1 FL=1
MSDQTCWKQSWTISGERVACGEVVESIREAMSDAGIGEAASFAVRLSLEEAIANAIRHGHAGDVTRAIAISAEVSPKEVELTIADHGPGFDPEAVPDPTAEENLTIASGRGLALMRAFMTEVEIPPPGNRIILIWRSQTGD